MLQIVHKYEHAIQIDGLADVRQANKLTSAFKCTFAQFHDANVTGVCVVTSAGPGA